MSKNYQIVLFTQGMLLLILGLALAITTLLDYVDGHPNFAAFGLSSVLAVFIGGGLCLSNRSFPKTLNIRQAFLLTSLSWLTVSVFAAIPLYMSDLEISFTDAFFESVSGVTTTGATVLSHLDDISRSVHLWRAITQWIGGIGVIAFAIILLPFLRIGGMQLFRSESSDQSDKIMPKTEDMVWSIVMTYIVLTVICFLSYFILGMGKYEALIHAMTTVPTGGFSSHDVSLGFYTQGSIHVAATLFMFLGSLPFILYVKYIYQGKFDFFKDDQVKTFAWVLLFTILILAFYLYYDGQFSFGVALRQSAFHIVSVMSTTGYVIDDYGQWGTFPVMLIFFLTYIGACAGSTAGGLKMLRLNIAFLALNRHLKTLIYPNAIFALRYQNRKLPSDVINAVMGFLFLYVFFNVALTVALTFTGLDFVTAISGAATALANVGPGLGNIIGPAGNFAALNDVAKWLLCLGMLLGRLEVMTLLVLITPAFWED